MIKGFFGFCLSFVIFICISCATCPQKECPPEDIIIRFHHQQSGLVIYGTVKKGQLENDYREKVWIPEEEYLKRRQERFY